MTWKILHDAELIELIQEEEMRNFLLKITKTYRQDVEYHNDLHGSDVMQMSYHMLTECKLRDMLKLNKLDCLSMIMASVSHDLGHDGFTNSYHVNAMTSRAIDTNDGAVQEFFHVAEMFRIMN